MEIVKYIQAKLAFPPQKTNTTKHPTALNKRCLTFVYMYEVNILYFKDIDWSLTYITK